MERIMRTLDLLKLDVPPGFLIPLIFQEWQKIHKKLEIFKFARSLENFYLWTRSRCIQRLSLRQRDWSLMSEENKDPKEFQGTTISCTGQGQQNPREKQDWMHDRTCRKERSMFDGQSMGQGSMFCSTLHTQFGAHNKLNV